MTLGAWTILSFLSSQVCDYEMSRLVMRGKHRRRRRNKGVKKERGEGQCSPLVQGQESVGRSDEVGGPLQEVAPQHEGRGSTPPNEG